MSAKPRSLSAFGSPPEAPEPAAGVLVVAGVLGGCVLVCFLAADAVPVVLLRCFFAVPVVDVPCRGVVRCAVALPSPRPVSAMAVTAPAASRRAARAARAGQRRGPLGSDATGGSGGGVGGRRERGSRASRGTAAGAGGGSRRRVV